MSYVIILSPPFFFFFLILLYIFPAMFSCMVLVCAFTLVFLSNRWTCFLGFMYTHKRNPIQIYHLVFYMITFYMVTFYMTTFLHGRLLFIVYIHIHDFYYDFGKTYSLVLGLVKCVAINVYCDDLFSSCLLLPNFHISPPVCSFWSWASAQ